MDYYSYTPYYKPRHVFKYPKFLTLALTIIIAYILFSGRVADPIKNLVSSFGLLGIFLGGMMYSYGFTAAPGTVILLLLGANNNIFLAAIIAGLGSLLSDLLIFSFVRVSFNDEIERLSHESWVIYFDHIMPKWLKKIFVPALGGLIIASPLPDEIGVTLIAAYKKFPAKWFALMSFLLNTSGILFVLWLGRTF